MIINEALNFANKELKKFKVKSNRIDSEVLLSHILNVDRSKILVNQHKNINKNDLKKYLDLINQRKNKKPISLIVGRKDFWKYTFFLNKHTLTPRPETEHLVEISLNILKKERNYKILDIGTGSGCIIISILKERSISRGVALDISKEALNIAKYNAKIHQIENRIKFFNSGVDKFLIGTYDLIVSNPPYIDNLKLKYLEEDVRFYDPILALNGGVGGLEVIKSIILKASKLLKVNGNLILEIDPIQKNKVIDILKKNDFVNNKIVKDYSNKPRFILSSKLN